jgi:predicted RNA-binding Zn-ribbon protein involved in translation (DUF1610 family)
MSIPQTEIFPCLLYECPNCGENNTVRSQSELIHANFRCKKCKHEHSIRDLIEFNERQQNGKNLDFAWAEFMCDCGETNIVQMHQNTKTCGLPLQDGVVVKLNKISLTAPKTAICGECWQMYSLQMVVPESHEKRIMNN